MSCARFFYNYVTQKQFSLCTKMHNTLVTTCVIVTYFCYKLDKKVTTKSISLGNKIINSQFLTICILSLGFKFCLTNTVSSVLSSGWTVLTYIQHWWCSAQRTFLKTFYLFFLKFWTSNTFGRNHAKCDFSKIPF